jgi:hypothetical protein
MKSTPLALATNPGATFAVAGPTLDLRGPPHAPARKGAPEWMIPRLERPDLGGHPADSPFNPL